MSQNDHDVSMRDYVDSQIKGLAAYMDIRFREHQNVHDEMTKALDLSTGDLRRRFENVNELRAQVLQERGMFVRRELHDILVERVGRTERLIPMVSMLGAIVSAIVTALVLNYWGR